MLAPECAVGAACMKQHTHGYTHMLDILAYVYYDAVVRAVNSAEDNCGLLGFIVVPLIPLEVCVCALTIHSTGCATGVP